MAIMSELDEVHVIYFVLCDQVITEANSSKQSLIGIYSSMIVEQLPASANLAVAVGLRVQSARQRELSFRFTGPQGEMVFSSPPLPYSADPVEMGLHAAGFASLQIGLNLRSMPFNSPGIYTAAFYCDGVLIATYPLSVMVGAPR